MILSPFSIPRKRYSLSVPERQWRKKKSFSNCVNQDAAKRDTSHLSKLELTNLSGEIGSFHSSCSGFIDSVPPTTRFRFRSLLTKLDQQSKEFSANVTSSGSAGSTTSNRLAGDIQVTLRDLVTVIQRWNPGEREVRSRRLLRRLKSWFL